MGKKRRIEGISGGSIFAIGVAVAVLLFFHLVLNLLEEVFAVLEVGIDREGFLKGGAGGRVVAQLDGGHRHAVVDDHAIRRDLSSLITEEID